MSLSLYRYTLLRAGRSLAWVGLGWGGGGGGGGGGGDALSREDSLASLLSPEGVNDRLNDELNGQVNDQLNGQLIGHGAELGPDIGRGGLRIEHIEMEGEGGISERSSTGIIEAAMKLHSIITFG
jgi:hypothetical protein